MISALTALNAEEQEEVPTPSEEAIHKIKRINLQIWPDRHDSWDCNSFLEWVQFARKNRFNVKPFLKREWTFNLLAKHAEKHKFTPSSVIKNETPWTDLNLFKGGKNLTSYVANNLDRTVTELGKVHLYTTLAYPITDSGELTKRQNTLKYLTQESTLRNDIADTLKEMQAHETVMLGFWQQDPFKRTAEHFYFGSTYETEESESFFDTFNEHENMLLVGSAYNNSVNTLNTIITTFAAGTLISYGLLKLCDIDIPWLTTQADRYNGNASIILTPAWEPSKTYRILHAFFALACGGWCATRIKNTAEWNYGCFLVEKSLQEIMHAVSIYVKGMYVLHRYIELNPTLQEFDAFKPLNKFFTQQKENVEKLCALLTLLETKTITGEYSISSHKGVILRAFALMHAMKSTFVNALGAVASLDMYTGLATLVAEHETKPAHFCYATYTQAATPHIKVERFWHPMIDAETVVPNSLILGTDAHRPNAIITGPNEGGKSTILKSLTIALIMAQSFGIAPADSLELTPFASIETYLNIADDIGSDNSLFKAEVLRAQELLTRVETAQPHEFTFAVFDEVLNSTSSVEGAAAAYSIAKYIGQFPNSLCLVATHFPLLTQLETDTNTFTNYKVVVNRSVTRSITYPRRFERGVSDQHVALDILENQGFAGNILDDARLKIKEMQKIS